MQHHLGDSLILTDEGNHVRTIGAQCGTRSVVGGNHGALALAQRDLAALELDSTDLLRVLKAQVGTGDGHGLCAKFHVAVGQHQINLILDLDAGHGGFTALFHLSLHDHSLAVAYKRSGLQLLVSRATIGYVECLDTLSLREVHIGRSHEGGIAGSGHGNLSLRRAVIGDIGRCGIETAIGQRPDIAHGESHYIAVEGKAGSRSPVYLTAVPVVGVGQTIVTTIIEALVERIVVLERAVTTSREDQRIGVGSVHGRCEYGIVPDDGCRLVSVNQGHQACAISPATRHLTDEQVVFDDSTQRGTNHTAGLIFARLNFGIRVVVAEFATSITTYLTGHATHMVATLHVGVHDGVALNYAVDGAAHDATGVVVAVHVGVDKTHIDDARFLNLTEEADFARSALVDGEVHDGMSLAVVCEVLEVLDVLIGNRCHVNIVGKDCT